MGSEACAGGVRVTCGTRVHVTLSPTCHRSAFCALEVEPAPVRVRKRNPVCVVGDTCMCVCVVGDVYVCVLLGIRVCVCELLGRRVCVCVVGDVYVCVRASLGIRVTCRTEQRSTSHVTGHTSHVTRHT